MVYMAVTDENYITRPLAVSFHILKKKNYITS